ncbi:hypothetical protein SAMN04515671_4184 [Nakamurella panacisegetis]|uniref:Uncharacterized protein n=1 Tax=Nakamurella panacisegetis TaxID=1090615 RepID=A0A1H0SMA2_9ACTN|nr:DUF6191 domain-containing protein [Nakamurella panacisegetis]SDP42795.1 hypothetical protein SAMN04515671_4184 [Nakamurella panacisegetis]
MGELGALFNPGMRHEIEERESKANRREEEGNARDGDLRIDLLSGVAVINVPGKQSGDDTKPSTSRTVGEKPAASAARPARAQARARAAAAKDAAAHENAPKPSSTRSSGSKSEPAASPAPRPSSKASRAAR